MNLYRVPFHFYHDPTLEYSQPIFIEANDLSHAGIVAEGTLEEFHKGTSAKCEVNGEITEVTLHEMFMESYAEMLDAALYSMLSEGQQGLVHEDKEFREIVRTDGFIPFVDGGVTYIDYIYPAHLELTSNSPLSIYWNSLRDSWGDISVDEMRELELETNICLKLHIYLYKKGRSESPDPTQNTILFKSYFVTDPNGRESMVSPATRKPIDFTIGYKEWTHSFELGKFDSTIAINMMRTAVTHLFSLV